MSLKKISFLILLSLVFVSCGEQNNDKKTESAKTTERKVVIPKIDKRGPFLAVKASIPKLIEIAERENPQVSTEQGFAMLKTAVEHFQVSELAVFLSSGETLPQITILLKANTEKLKNLEQNPMLSQVLIKTAENLYSFKEELIPKDAKDALGPYQLKVEGDYALILPQNSQLTVSGLQASSANEKADVLFQKNKGLAFTCIVADEMAFNLSDLLQANEAIGDNRITNQIGEVFDKLLDQFKDSIEKIDYFTLAFDMSPEMVKLDLEQQFRDHAVGLDTMAALTTDSQEIDFDFVSDIKGVLVEEKLQKKFSYENGVLQGSFSWKKEDSRLVVRKLGGMIMGSLFTVPDPVATEGELELAYETASPEIRDLDKIKKDLPRLVQYAAFPDKFYENSEHMTVHFEEIPGFGFRGNSLKYELLELRDKSGKIIPLKAPEDDRFNTLQSFIWIKFSERLKTFEPGQVKIKLTSEVAPVVESFEFKKSDKDKVLKSKNAAVKLAYIDRDAVKILVKGSDKIKILAYDKSGRILKKKSVNGFSQNTKANYMGEVDRIQVRIFGDKQKIEVTTTLDLTPTLLPKEPSDVSRIRKGHESSFYDDYTMNELKKLKVEKEDHPSRGTRLRIDLNEKKPSLRAEWNVYALNGKKVEHITDTGSSYNGALNFSLRQYKDSIPFAGYVQCKVKTGVELFELLAPKEGKETRLRTKSGLEMKVKFNKNHVVISSPKMTRDNFTAYDENGIVLKSGMHRTQSKNKLYTSTYSFWGTVHRIKFQTSVEEVSHTLHFDLPSSVDPQIINKTKADIQRHLQLLSTMQELKEARDSHSVLYGANLAYLHYSNQSISKELANSDPLAVADYAYTLAPFEGYYFTLAEGKINYSNKKEPFTDKYTRKKKLIINGKEIEVAAHNGAYKLPFIVAYPVDQSKPTYFMTSNEIFWKVCSEKVKYFPQNARNDGWNRLYLK